MRIGFDVRPFLKQETGVGVFFKNLLFELAALDRENEYCLFSASWKDRFPKENIPPFERMCFVDKKWPVRLVNASWDRFNRPRLDRVFDRRLDLAHSPTPLRLPASGKAIVTVCDLFFLEEPDKADREARKRFLHRVEESLRTADGIVTISEYSAGEIKKRFRLDPAKVKVTHLGTSIPSSAGPSVAEIEAVRRKLDLPGGFLLFVGALEPRKNIPVLIESLAIIRAGRGPIPLVLAGRSGGDGETVARTVERFGLQADVRRPGYLSDLEIRALYRSASALVFPSLAEGFGLPLLEAMASGLPAAVSAAAALPEIGGDAALYFEPGDPEDIARTIRRLLDDETLQADLRRKGRERAARFTWGRTAHEMLDFYRAITGGS
ncbi:MAG: glycosyltransferase family 4 protein [Candidatus Aminicenantes bacterium]|nr:glycosyltransferase family 4 protein [Candidatus Aminicenantes bacterium]